MVKKRGRCISGGGMDFNPIIGVGALLFSKETSRYLFLLRNKKKHKNSWGFVGGGVEDGESVRDALIREINEEINLDTSNHKFIPIEQFTSEDCKFIYHTFLIPIEQEFIPILNNEHKGYCWVHLDDYPRPLHPGVWRTFNFASIFSKIKLMETIKTS